MWGLWALNLGYAQAQESNVKGEFLAVIKQEFASLKAWGEEDKANPQGTLQYSKYDKLWHAFYEDYYTFEYDIQKTTSIVSPYIGVVTFKAKVFEKKGPTEVECLNADWSLMTGSKGMDMGNKHPTLKYAYQDGKWVLKEQPRAYKKH
jgi:hypothetical protein